MSDTASGVVDSRAKIKEIYVKAARLLERMEDSERLAELVPVYNRMEMGIFRLVVMGEIKKGKSSFINALLGEPELLPTASDIATSTVYKILYGPERKIKVFFRPDVDTGQREQPLEIVPGQIGDYGTEAGNPGNKKKVDFIGIELPNPMLKSGLVIVDTPGVGGLFREHRDITLRYAPNADAVFFVVDSVESVISRPEIEFLKELLKMSSHRVVFVQTKIDAADEESWKAWQARNQKIIAEEVGLPVDKQLYFPVSAEIKVMADEEKDGELLDESGYLTLLNYLNHRLIPRKEQTLAKDAAAVFRACLAEIAEVQKRSVNVLQQSTREALAEMQQRLVEKKKQMIEWRSTTFQTEVQSFNDQFRDLRRNTGNRMREELDPTGPLISTHLDRLRSNEELKAPEIAANIKQYQQDLLIQAAESATAIHTQFNNDFKDIFSRAMNNLGASYEVEVAIAAEEPSADETMLQTSLNMHFSAFENTRTGLYGGMAGSTITGFLASWIFPPAGIAVMIAAVGGALIGGSLANKDAEVRQRNEALQRMRQVLQELAGKILRHSMNQLDDMTTCQEREANAAFKKIADRMQSDLEKEMTELQEAVTATKQEKSEKLKSSMETLDETSRLIADVEALLKA
jgi:GTPase SAR1 family protein